MADPPLTYRVSPDVACDQLDHADMVALAGMFRRWAIYETDVSPERRTELIKYSADYERLAEWVGSDWRARTRVVGRPPLMKFLAMRERETDNVVDFGPRNG